jgi:hypothetical protein
MQARGIIYRHWFVLAIIVAAALLAAGQLAMYLAFKPDLVFLAAGAALSTFALLTFACVLACATHRLRRWWADVRYRWLTRTIDRKMRRTGR